MDALHHWVVQCSQNLSPLHGLNPGCVRDPRRNRQSWCFCWMMCGCVDVMMSGLVPFLPCPLSQGPEKNPQNYEQNPAGVGYLTAHSVRGGPDPGEIDLWYPWIPALERETELGAPTIFSPNCCFENFSWTIYPIFTSLLLSWTFGIFLSSLWQK